MIPKTRPISDQLLCVWRGASGESTEEVQGGVALTSCLGKGDWEQQGCALVAMQIEGLTCSLPGNLRPHGSKLTAPAGVAATMTPRTSAVGNNKAPPLPPLPREASFCNGHQRAPIPLLTISHRHTPPRPLPHAARAETTGRLAAKRPVNGGRSQSDVHHRVSAWVAAWSEASALIPRPHYAAQPTLRCFSFKNIFRSFSSSFSSLFSLHLPLFYARSPGSLVIQFSSL